MATLRETVEQSRFQPPTWTPEGRLDPGSAEVFGHHYRMPGSETWQIIPEQPKRAGRTYRLGGGGRRAPSRTTITQRKPTRPAPTAPAIPAFKAPEYDEAEIRKLTQKLAAPRLRSLRRQMERESARQYENPNVRRMTLRQAMEGYGLGIGRITAEAGAGARAEYGQRYAREFAGAQMTYTAKTQALMQSYQNAFNAYLQSMQQTVTTGPSGTEPGTISTGWRKEDFGPQAWARFGKYVGEQDQSWREPPTRRI